MIQFKMTQLNTEIVNLKKPQTNSIATPETNTNQNAKASIAVFNSVKLTLLLCTGFLFSF